MILPSVNTVDDGFSVTSLCLEIARGHELRHDYRREEKTYEECLDHLVASHADVEPAAIGLMQHWAEFGAIEPSALYELDVRRRALEAEILRSASNGSLPRHLQLYTAINQVMNDDKQTVRLYTQLKAHAQGRYRDSVLKLFWTMRLLEWCSDTREFSLILKEWDVVVGAIELTLEGVQDLNKRLADGGSLPRESLNEMYEILRETLLRQARTLVNAAVAASDHDKALVATSYVLRADCSEEVIVKLENDLRNVVQSAELRTLTERCSHSSSSTQGPDPTQVDHK